jgi:hypothetical protein
MECLQLFTNTILTLVSRIPNVCREQSNSSTARGIPDNITLISCVFICDGNNDYGNLRQLPVKRAYSVKLCRGTRGRHERQRCVLELPTDNLYGVDGPSDRRLTIHSYSIFWSFRFQSYYQGGLVRVSSF